MQKKHFRWLFAFEEIIQRQYSLFSIELLSSPLLTLDSWGKDLKSMFLRINCICELSMTHIHTKCNESKQLTNCVWRKMLDIELFFLVSKEQINILKTWFATISMILSSRHATSSTKSSRWVKSIEKYFKRIDTNSRWNEFEILLRFPFSSEVREPFASVSYLSRILPGLLPT